MSTNAAIGIRENGIIRVVYCHWDGYPEYVGAILYGHYNSISKIKKLLALGSLSSLGERVEPRDPNNHSFDKPESGTTVAYHRDRGEEKSKILKMKDTELSKINFGEYAYIYDVETKNWTTFKASYEDTEDGYRRKWHRMALNQTLLIENAIKERCITTPRGWAK